MPTKPCSTQLPYFCMLHWILVGQSLFLVWESLASNIFFIQFQQIVGCVIWDELLQVLCRSSLSGSLESNMLQKMYLLFLHIHETCEGIQDSERSFKKKVLNLLYTSSSQIIWSLIFFSWHVPTLTRMSYFCKFSMDDQSLWAGSMQVK